MITLVTGATGHVGLTLVQRLVAEGKTVHTLAYDTGRSLDELKRLGVRHWHADVSRYADIAPAFAGVETVFHLAARVSYRDRGWAELKAVNVDGARNVIAACRQHGIRRLVHFSSIEALSPYPVDQVLDETRPLVDDQFRFPYPRSKAMGQRLVLDAQRDGLDAVIIYPTAVIGPNDYAFRAANRQILRFTRGEYQLTEGGFDFVDARDVAEVALRAASAPAGSSYLAAGGWHAFAEMAEIVARHLGKPLPRYIVPIWQMNAVAPLLSWWNDWRKQPPTLTVAAAHAVTHWRDISHARAARELGYQPRPFAQSVIDTVEWIRANDLAATR